MNEELKWYQVPNEVMTPVMNELWRAYYKENGYGGDTAEIYSYVLSGVHFGYLRMDTSQFEHLKEDDEAYKTLEEQQSSIIGALKEKQKVSGIINFENESDLNDAEQKYAQIAAERLYSICKYFEVTCGGEVFVDDVKLGEWLKKSPFSWRVEVRVSHSAS